MFNHLKRIEKSKKFITFIENALSSNKRVCLDQHLNISGNLDKNKIDNDVNFEEIYIGDKVFRQTNLKEKIKLDDIQYLSDELKTRWKETIDQLFPMIENFTIKGQACLTIDFPWVLNFPPCRGPGGSIPAGNVASLVSSNCPLWEERRGNTTRLPWVTTSKPEEGILEVESYWEFVLS